MAHIVRHAFDMHHPWLARQLRAAVDDHLAAFPAVAVLGPRQCGKSTLAKDLIRDRQQSIYLDLERPSDLRKLADPELFFDAHREELICLDEIQRVPELFTVLRSVIDSRYRPGQFLILGSASRDLIRQSSETLAGRIAHLELTPFLWSEVETVPYQLNTYFVRGGFPRSLLARSDEASFDWRVHFVRTFLERDIPLLGIRIPSTTIERTWKMCAHYHGQLLNLSRLGEALGVRHPTVRSYIDLLSQTFMLRLLPPLHVNLKKRLVKSPKIYLRDTGILHALLEVTTFDDLLGHPVVGASWEGLVIENVLAARPAWRGSFYRTAKGAELDLVLERGQQRIAIECKMSSAPKVTQGFWNALEDLGIGEAWIIAPVKESYPLGKGVTVMSLSEFLCGGA